MERNVNLNAIQMIQYYESEKGIKQLMKIIHSCREFSRYKINIQSPKIIARCLMQEFNLLQKEFDCQFTQ